MSEHIHDLINSIGNHILDTLPEVGGVAGGVAIAATNSGPSYTHIMIGATIGAVVGWLVKKGLDLLSMKIENYYKPKQ